MGEAEHRRASTLIQGHLLQALGRRSPGALGFCWPVRSEFDPLPLAFELHHRGWQLCMPVVVAAASPMAFRLWTPHTAMKPGYYGIPIPDDETAVAPDTLLLPLVAFDPHGYRLGYGGGYFDRTLAALTPRPTTLGVGFELGRVDTTHPGRYDIPLDQVVTEAGILVVNKT